MTDSQDWWPADMVTTAPSSSAGPGIAAVYGSADAKEKFAQDFATAWAKVMDLDRFELR